MPFAPQGLSADGEVSIALLIQSLDCSIRGYRLTGFGGPDGAGGVGFRLALPNLRIESRPGGRSYAAVVRITYRSDAA